MKNKIVFLMLVSASFFLTRTGRAAMIVDGVQVGCGFSDLAYADIASHLSEKTRINMTLPSEGKETGRRLYFFSDDSWFLTFEYLSEASVDQDISCVVAKGPGSNSETALDFVLKERPQWLWGVAPQVWPSIVEP